MNREWERDVDRQLRELYDRTADLPFRTKNGGGGSGSGTSDTLHYRASTKADLPDPANINTMSIGRVEGEGEDNGMMCVVNPDGDGWDAFNVFE